MRKRAFSLTLFAAISFFSSQILAQDYQIAVVPAMLDGVAQEEWENIVEESAYLVEDFGGFAVYRYYQLSERISERNAENVMRCEDDVDCYIDELFEEGAFQYVLAISVIDEGADISVRYQMIDIFEGFLAEDQQVSLPTVTDFPYLMVPCHEALKVTPEWTDSEPIGVAVEIDGTPDEVVTPERSSGTNQNSQNSDNSYELQTYEPQNEYAQHEQMQGHEQSNTRQNESRSENSRSENSRSENSRSERSENRRTRSQQNNQMQRETELNLGTPEYLLMGGVTLFTAGIFMGFSADATQQEIQETPHPRDELISLQDQGQQQQMLANIMLGTGAASMAVGTFLYFKAHSNGQNNRRAQLSIDPINQWIGIQGRF